MLWLLKVLLWIAVLALPGGLLLLPVLYALHHTERARREAAGLPQPVRASRRSRHTWDVTVHRSA